MPVAAVTLCSAALAAMEAHAAATYPEECCGLLLAEPRNPDHVHLAFIGTNVQTRHHMRLPRIYERDGRTAYLLDPLDLARAQAEATATGARIAGVFHSHVEVGAYFSEEDRRQALGGGSTPLWPELVQLVLDAHQPEGRAVLVRALRAFRWDGGACDYRELGVQVTR